MYRGDPARIYVCCSRSTDGGAGLQFHFADVRSEDWALESVLLEDRITCSSHARAFIVASESPSGGKSSFPRTGRCSRHGCP